MMDGDRRPVASMGVGLLSRAPNKHLILLNRMKVRVNRGLHSDSLLHDQKQDPPLQVLYLMK